MRRSLRRCIHSLSPVFPAGALFSGPAAGQAKPNRTRLYADGAACPICAYGIEKEMSVIDGAEDLATDRS